jgi:ribosomal protein L24E
MTTELTTSLATETLSAYEAAQAKAKAAQEIIRQAILEACRCGELLATAKSENRKAWREWLAENLPSISPEEATRFISGSKKIKAAGLDYVNNRQLLLFFCNDESDEEKPAPVNRDPDGTKWFSFFGRAVESFTKQIEFRPVSEWTDAERIAFKRRAEPIVKVWGEL